jgi:hypothetical protein
MSEAAILSDRFEPAESASNRPCPRIAALCALGLLGASALGGCATEPKPTAQLVRASTLVSEAEKDGAQRYAAADLQRARDELSEAHTAESEGKNDRALRLAERAAADADLASARTASGKAQQSAGQVHRSIDTLRQQLQLQEAPTPPGNPGPGATGPGQNRP